MLPARLYFVFACAAAAGACCTWAVRRFALGRGFVSHPNPIVPQHRKPVAYLGGLGVFLGAAATALAFMSPLVVGSRMASPLPSPSLILPAALFLALGMIDDLWVLSPGAKFMAQGLTAAIAVAMGLVYPLTGYRLVDGAVSFLWICSLANAFNLIDVCDGLAAGLGAILLVFLAHLNAQQAGPALLLAGACVGFLVFNWPPASVFLGDAGSHLLGFAVAAIALTPPKNSVHWPYPAQAVLVAGVPLFEMVFLIVIRQRKGLPWWKGSPDHFSLRLQAAGLTRIQTDAVAWTAAVLSCLAAWALMRTGLGGQLAILIAALVALTAAGLLLLRWEVKQCTPAPPAETSAACAPGGTPAVGRVEQAAPPGPPAPLRPSEAADVGVAPSPPTPACSTIGNVISFDLEDWYHCLDQDPANWHRYEDRVAGAVSVVLDLLDATQTRATFFVLGHVAERHPELISRIDRCGHEIASHGWAHRFVYQQSPAEFEADVRRSTSILSSIIGRTILGYRAPYFSITDRSRWALDVLRRLGFRYDSSIFPIYNHHYGIPGAPRLPWRTAEGILEVPPSTFPAMHVNVPCGGGAYFRLLPYRAVRWMFRRLSDRHEPIVVYLHPWELDDKQPRIRVPAFLRLRHYWGLDKTADKVAALLSEFRFMPMKEALGL